MLTKKLLLCIISVTLVLSFVEAQNCTEKKKCDELVSLFALNNILEFKSL